MDFQATDKSCLNWSGDCLVIGVSEESLPLNGVLADLNAKLSGLVQEVIDEVEFKGKEGITVITRVGKGGPVRKLGLVGLGSADTLKLEDLRRAAASAARLASKEKCQQLGLSLPVWNNHPDLTAQALTEGVKLALYKDNRFKSESENTGAKVEQIDLLGLPGQAAAIQLAEQTCDGVILARELVAAPPNVVTPDKLVETAAAIAQAHGMELQVLEREDCEKLGMGAFLGVAQASDLPSQVYSPHPQAYRRPSPQAGDHRQRADIRLWRP